MTNLSLSIHWGVKHIPLCWGALHSASTPNYENEFESLSFFLAQKNHFLSHAQRIVKIDLVCAMGGHLQRYHGPKLIQFPSTQAAWSMVGVDGSCSSKHLDSTRLGWPDIFSHPIPAESMWKWFDISSIAFSTREAAILDPTLLNITLQGFIFLL